METLGMHLRALRKQHRWNQTDAAARVGISRTYLSNLERDLAAHPSMTVLAQLARAYAVPGTSLLVFMVPISPIQEALGQVVRAAWVAWAQRQPNPKPSWLVPWDELSAADKEADRCIGVAVATYIATRWQDVLAPPA